MTPKPDASLPAPATPIPFPAWWSGHEALADEIAKTLAHLDTGACSLALVTGGGGAGKTYLLNAVKTRAAQEGYLVTWVHCRAEDSKPYGAIATALGLLVRRLQQESTEAVTAVQSSILRALGENAGVVEGVAPPVAEFLGTHLSVPELPPLQHEERLRTSLLTFLAALRLHFPICLFFDDAQWMDDASMKLLQKLAHDRARHNGYALCLAYETDRPRESPRHTSIQPLLDLPWATAHKIRPQTAVDLCTWLRSFAAPGEEAKLKDLAEQIGHKSGGNALALKLFVEEYAQRNFMRYAPESGGWTFDLARISGTSVSATVADLLMETIRLLEPESRTVLEAASCIGLSFQVSLLEALHPVASSQRLQEILQELLRFHYISEGDSPKTCQFAHRKLYDAFASNDRAHQWHRRLATLLENEPTGPDTIFAIAYHRNRGTTADASSDERRELFTTNLVAMEHALKSAQVKDATAFKQAAEAARATLTDLPFLLEWRLEMARGQLQFLSADVAGAMAIFERLANAPATDGGSNALQRLHAAYQLAYVRFSQGEYRDTIAVGRTMWSLAELPRLSITPASAKHALQALIRRGQDADLRAACLSLSPAPAEHEIIHQAVALYALALFVSSTHTDELALVCERYLAYAERDGRTESFGVVMGCIYTLLLPGASHLNSTSHLRVARVRWNEATRNYMRAYPTRYAASIFFMLGNGGVGESGHLQTSWNDPAADSRRGIVAAEANADYAARGLLLIQSQGLAMHIFGYEAWNLAFEEYKRFLHAAYGSSPELVKRKYATSIGRMLEAQWQYLRHTTLNSGLFDRTQLEPLTTVTQPSMWKTICRLGALLCFAIANDWEGAAWMIREGAVEIEQCHHIVLRLHVNIGVALACALACREADLTDLDFGWATLVHRCENHLSDLASDLPDVYGGMEELLAAEKQTEHPAAALPLFLRAASRLVNSPVLWLAAFAQERAARFCRAHGFEWIGLALAEESCRPYGKWGALIKVRQLRSEFRGIKQIGLHGEDLVRRPDGEVASACLGAIEAGDTLPSSSEALRHIAKEMLAVCDADRCIVAVRTAMGELEPVCNVASDRNGTEETVHSGSDEGAMPIRLLRHVQSSGERVHGDHRSVVDKVGYEPFVARSQSSTIYCAPVQHGEDVLGVVYLAQNARHDAFTEQQIAHSTTMCRHGLIAAQYSLLKNRMDEVVESRVSLRESALTKQRNISRTASERRMAGGFAHEMLNRLTAARSELFCIAEVEPARGLARVTQRLSQEGAEGVQRFSGIIADVDVNLEQAVFVSQRILSFGLLAQRAVERGKAPVQDALEHVLQKMQAVTDINLVIDVEAGLAAATEPQDLETIIEELLSNASWAAQHEAAGKSAAVTIAAQRRGDDCAICISDSGAGVPLELEARIFEPFFSTRGAGGMGLGLCIAQKLAEAYGGRLSLQHGKSEGATFEVTLPAEHI